MVVTAKTISLTNSVHGITTLNIMYLIITIYQGGSIVSPTLREATGIAFTVLAVVVHQIGTLDPLHSSPLLGS